MTHIHTFELHLKLTLLLEALGLLGSIPATMKAPSSTWNRIPTPPTHLHVNVGWTCCYQTHIGLRCSRNTIWICLNTHSVYACMHMEVLCVHWVCFRKILYLYARIYARKCAHIWNFRHVCPSAICVCVYKFMHVFLVRFVCFAYAWMYTRCTHKAGMHTKEKVMYLSLSCNSYWLSKSLTKLEFLISNFECESMPEFMRLCVHVSLQ